MTSPRLSDLTPTQYETALLWLTRTGLLTEDANGAPATVRVYARAVAEAAWFRDADLQVREPSELPEDALIAADALSLDSNEAFQHLVTSWGKVDTELRARIGAAGEAALVSLLKESVNAEVEQVSQWSDGLGYDIAVRASDFASHLEVKSSTRRGRLTIYLSRNEFEVMRRDANWTLVAVTLSPDHNVVDLRTVRSTWLSTAAPRDIGSGGRWQSCRFDIPTEETTPGIPALDAVLQTSASLILGGH
ncbi:DUF3883 domain-containing protein [Kribbella sp. NPDC051587]|uniref:DUF3883 domain-containing protein n=1 Tax=Kribbella sp. NPDC051587 TaxID=3364119 RepID=UPI0037B97F7F